MSFAMDEHFVLDAPHFVDLTNADEDLNDSASADEYFFQTCSIERYETDDTAILQSSNTMFFSPSDSKIELQQPLPEVGNSRKMRRSMSNGNLVMFSEQKGRLLQEPTCKVIKENESTGGLSKARSKSTCKGSMDQLNKGAQPKQYGSYDNLKKLNQNKFVSMAEQISMFQNRTPERFRVKAPVHTKPALQKTIPESPALTTKLRARPDQQKILSHEERELNEFHNLQKCKIKANPVNKKILQGPVKALVPVEKKPSTVPVPFKLTEIPPKQTAPSPKKYVFHATPILKPSPQKTAAVTATRSTTKPITPTFMKNYKPPMRCVSKVTTATVNPEVNRPRMTKPEPFSFADRDRLVTEKREKLIQKILEEERRAREFHANPIPKSIYKSGSKRTSMESINSTKKGSKSSSEDLSSNFKARPAKVLQKKPFIPARSDKIPTVPEPFELESERRRLERLAFEEKQRQKMETMRNLELHRDELKKAAEKEEIARLRKLAETKARPIPNFKPMEIHSSDKKLTEPKSPNFRKINKENFPSNN